MKLALIQMHVKNTPAENIERIKQRIQEAKILGADMAVFPEMCACPYENTAFMRHAMEQEDSFLLQIATAAKKQGIYVVAGSVPEKENAHIYNTSFVFDPEGNFCAKHRKIHLFDINITGGQTFMESDTFTKGDTLTTFATPWGIIGLCICYDIRFPELCRLMALRGAKGILVPAAFNMTTGPAHWEITFRTRALDNQVFMAGVAPARDNNASYIAWGHTISTDPWGRMIHQMDEREGISLVEWNMAELEKVRNELPLLKHLRTDLYSCTLNRGNEDAHKK